MSVSNTHSIAIIGAGIAGVTLAIALSKYNPDLNVSIYESRPAFSELAAGVGFGPNASKAMALISPKIVAAYDKVKTPNTWPEKDLIWYDIRYGEGSKAGELLGEFGSDKDYSHGGASRVHLLEGLVELIPASVKIHFGKKLKDVSEDEQGRMLVDFQDGTAAFADAVVGCDGIRSVCRRILLGEDDKSARAVYSGKYAYRKVVDMRKAVEAVGKEIENRTMYVGYGGHILSFPIKKGQALNMVIFRDAEGVPWTQRQWVVPSSRDDVMNDFKGWGVKPMRLLEVRSLYGKLCPLTDLPAHRFPREMGFVRSSTSAHVCQRQLLHPRRCSSCHNAPFRSWGWICNRRRAFALRIAHAGPDQING